VALLIRLGECDRRSGQVVTLGWANKVGGVLLYTALFTLSYSVASLYLSSMRLFSEKTLQESMTVELLLKLGPWTIEKIATLFPLFKDMFLALAMSSLPQVRTRLPA
jgi:membrane protein required for colicin V production